MAQAEPLVSSAAEQSRLETLRSELDGLIFRDVVGYHAKYFPSTSSTSVQSSLLQEFGSDPLMLLTAITARSKASSSHTFAPRNASEVVLVANSNLTLDDPISDAAILMLVDVFAARPHRLFLHAFRFYGSNLETWTFDRAGAYSGRVINMDNEPEMFQNIITGYLSMDDDRLGLNPIFNVQSQRGFVKLDALNQTGRLVIDLEAFVERDDFIGPGTSCFKASDADSLEKQLIVKFTWTPSELPGEYELLQIVRDKHVWGVVGLEGHQYLGDTEDLRCGLRFNQAYHFAETPSCQDDSTETTQANTTKALPSDGSAHHESVPAFEKLKFECIVTSPLGKPLDTFSSPLELFKILRDVVKALQSLYCKANIIHRDISTRNIIVAPKDEQNDNAPLGMLIDLSLALDLSNPPEKEDLVGSEGFMAIGILGGDKVTYRHDLESVFYVFIWMAICHDGTTSDHIPNTSRLHKWLGTDWPTVFHTKMKDMQPAILPAWIKEEFSATFKPHLPLALRLHTLLFPSKNGSIDIGTNFDPGSTTRLYEDMVAAFGQTATTRSAGSL